MIVECCWAGTWCCLIQATCETSLPTCAHLRRQRASALLAAKAACRTRGQITSLRSVLREGERAGGQEGATIYTDDSGEGEGERIFLCCFLSACARLTQARARSRGWGGKAGAGRVGVSSSEDRALQEDVSDVRARP